MLPLVTAPAFATKHETSVKGTASQWRGLLRGGVQAFLDQLLDLAVLHELLLFEPRLLSGQLHHRVRIDPFIPRGEAAELPLERDVVGAELDQLGLLHRALGVPHERAVALDIEAQVFGGNFVLRGVFEFQGPGRNAPQSVLP